MSLTAIYICISSSLEYFFCRATVVLEGRIRNRQQTGFSQNSLWSSALSVVAGAGGTHSPALCGVVLVCPAWPVARQVNDPGGKKKQNLSTPQLPPLPVIAEVQTNWACKRERERDKRERILWQCCIVLIDFGKLLVLTRVTDTRCLSPMPIFELR